MQAMAIIQIRHTSILNRTKATLYIHIEFYWRDVKFKILQHCVCNIKKKVEKKEKTYFEQNGICAINKHKNNYTIYIFVVHGNNIKAKLNTGFIKFGYYLFNI